MGLFISNCKKCYAEIHWFLYSSDRVCEKCNQHMTAKEIEDSFHANSIAHYTKLVLQLKAEGKTIDEVKKILALRPDFIEQAYNGTP